MQETPETCFWSLVRKGPWRRKWQLAPVFFPGKSHGQRIPTGYSPWGCKESDMTDWVTKHIHMYQFSSVAQSCPTLCDPMNCSTPGFPVLHDFLEHLKLRSIDSVMSSNHLILCHPLLHLPSIFLGVRVFSCESALRIRWPKYWNFSFSISSSNEYSWLISFRLSPVDVGIWVFSSRIFSMGMCTNKQRRFYKNGIVIDRLFWTFFSHSVICWEHLSLLINIGL